MITLRLTFMVNMLSLVNSVRQKLLCCGHLFSINVVFACFPLVFATFTFQQLVKMSLLQDSNFASCFVLLMSSSVINVIKKCDKSETVLCRHLLFLVD